MTALNIYEQRLVNEGYNAMALFSRNELLMHIGNTLMVDYSTLTEADVLKFQKDLKISIFKETCENEILEGFTSSINGHVYRTNRDDQINMIGQKDILDSDPSITEVFWKTEDAGYVSHTREDWIKIYNEGFNYKKAILYKYDTLKKQVELATTDAEVVAIVW